MAISKQKKPIDRDALAAKLDGLEIAIGGTVTGRTAMIIGEVSAALKAEEEVSTAVVMTKPTTLPPPPFVADAQGLTVDVVSEPGVRKTPRRVSDK